MRAENSEWGVLRNVLLFNENIAITGFDIFIKLGKIPIVIKLVEEICSNSGDTILNCRLNEIQQKLTRA